MLERALRRGYSALAQRFIEHRNESERCKYVALAAKQWNSIVLRWMLENGTPIDVAAAIDFATERCYAERVEIAGYLPEGDRVQLVREAVTKTKLHKLLLWTLENTSFTDDSSRFTIAKAIQQAPTKTAQWIRENLADGEVRKWCLKG